MTIHPRTFAHRFARRCLLKGPACGVAALNAIAPTQSSVVMRVVMRALVAGCCANFLNACLMGVLL